MANFDERAALADPRIQALQERYRALGGGTHEKLRGFSGHRNADALAPLNAELDALSGSLPEHHAFTTSGDGTIGVSNKNWLERNAATVFPLALAAPFAAPALGGMFGGGGAAAAGATAPATGGGVGFMSAASRFLDNPLVQGAGKVLTGMAGQSAENRAATDQSNLVRDQIAASTARDASNAEMDRARLQLEQQEQARASEADAFRKVMQAALMLNATDNRIDPSQFRTEGVPSLSFGPGVRSTFGEQGQAGAAALEGQALRRLMEGDERRDVAEYEAPEQSKPSTEGFWERLAGMGGLGLSAIGAANTLGQPRATSAPQAPSAPGRTGIVSPQPFDGVRF